MLRTYKGVSVWYILGLLLWLGIYVLRKYGIIIPIINNHLTDLYSVPMFCYTINLLMDAIFKTKRVTALKDILFSTFYLTIIFEVICPKISNIYTADILDALCYLIGGILYYLVLKGWFVCNYR